MSKKLRGNLIKKKRLQKEKKKISSVKHSDEKSLKVKKNEREDESIAQVRSI